MKTIDCLIVEDSPTQAMQLEQLLTENSFSVEVARNGSEALASLDQCTPLVVISDVVMPVMDGYELCRRIKASPKHKGILVMLLTSLSEAEDIFRALECGADNFVTKPAAPEQLLSRLNYLMANCKVRDEEQMSAGLEVSFGGERQFITSSRLQILNLLLTTYDVAVQKNKELIDASEALHRLNADLERQVEDRTQHMLAEIEQRKAAEANLSLLATAVEQFAPGVAIMDLQGAIVFANAGMERVCQAFRSQLASINNIDLGRGESTGKTLSEVWAGLSRGTVTSLEEHFIRTQERSAELVCSAHFSPVYNEQNIRTHYLLLAEDVTDQRRLEIQVRRKQQLESLGTLAGGIAHDFNNILAAILGYTDIAFADIDDPQALEEDLRFVQQAGVRAKNLVQQILSISRPSEGKLIPTDVEMVIREALEFLRATLPKSIEIQTHFDTRCGEVMADPTQIHQVMMNLCTNAYHAIGQAGGQIRISTEPYEINGGNSGVHPDLRSGMYIRICVSDTGHGMDKETMARIFDPFFTTKPAGSGTGLGLSVSHRIVRDYKGAITVYSEPGTGTTFHIYLPVVSEQEFTGESERVGPSVGGTEHILVVDDEPILVTLVTRKLKKLGYTVDAFTNPWDCLNAVHEKPASYQLLISDATMPGLMGEELAAAILPLAPTLPVLLLSGYGAVRLDAEKHPNIKGALVKPVADREFFGMIRRILEESKAEESA